MSLIGFLPIILIAFMSGQVDSSWGMSYGTTITPIMLIFGAVLPVPLFAYIVNRLPAGMFTMIIGGISTALGGYTLVRLMI